jgi:hypothetical protein
MSGGWLGEQFNRVQGEAARIGNQVYDNGLGSLGGWMGDHVFGDKGFLADYTRGLNTMSAGGATGTGILGMLASQKKGYEQEGASSGRALGKVGTMQGESLLAMLAALGGAAYGAGSAGASSGLGSGGTFSGALGESSVMPSFSAAAPSVGGTGVSSFFGSTPSIGGTGTAAFSLGGGSSSSMLNDLLNQAMKQKGSSSSKSGQSAQSLPTGGDQQAAPVVLNAATYAGQFSPFPSYNLSNPTDYLTYVNNLLGSDSTKSDA